MHLYLLTLTFNVARYAIILLYVMIITLILMIIINSVLLDIYIYIYSEIMSLLTYEVKSTISINISNGYGANQLNYTIPWSESVMTCERTCVQ